MRIIIRVLQYGFSITAVLFLLSSSCNKDGTRPCVNTPYSFAVSCKWTPEREVYNIGDTIFFESSFPKTLSSLLNPSTVVNYSNSTGIGGGIGFGYMDTFLRQMLPAKNSFETIAIIGTFSELSNDQNQRIHTQYFEEDQNYHFKGAIICKKKGIYSVGVSDLYSSGIRGKNCTNAEFVIKVANTNQHLDLHQYALGINPNDHMLQRTGYDFRVQ